MARWHLAKRTTKLLTVFLGVSVVVVALISGFLGVRGGRVELTVRPSQPYQEVSFSSLARDQLILDGWYFPADSVQTAVIVHGWSGHRGRWLDLAEYLQRSGVNVLTFDLRGGTGRNTYGQRESGDLAGAIEWLKTDKKVDQTKLAVLGSSMGATAVVGYATGHQLGRLVLFGPVIDLKQVKRTVLKDRYVFWPALYANAATWVERVIFGVEAVNPIAIFGQIEEPTLIIHAENDELSKVESVRRLEKEATDQGQTNLRVIYLPTGGHTFMDEDKANGFPYAKIIAEFVKQN